MTCIKCNGRGGFRDGFGRWRRCSCKRPSKATQLADRQMVLATIDDPEQRARAEASWAEHDHNMEGVSS